MLARILLLLALAALARAENYEWCGVSKYDDAPASSYIIGGQKARAHEFPWVVSIRWKGYSHLYAHTCMGILVREDWVLTAGHCVVSMPLSSYVVAVGTNNIFDTAETNPYRQEMEVEDWFWYPDVAKDMYFEGDIALIKLKEKVVLNENVRTICPPHPDYDYADQIGVVAGWGEQTYGTGDYSEDLKYVEAKIMTNDMCRTRMRGVTDNMFCAGDLYEDRDAPCGGDNGAALVVWRYDRWELVGIVDWSDGCANRSPVVYTRINKYTDWMDTIIETYPNIPNYP